MSDVKQGSRAASSSGGAKADAAEKLGRKAADVASKASGAVSDTADLASAAGDLASVALEQGRTLIGTARGQATGFVDRRKDDAAQTVGDLANSLRATGDQFEGRANIQAFVGSAADGLEQLASSIRERSVGELYGEFETYARARPVAVAAASVVAGFLLARFIKSSAETLSETSRDVVLRRTAIRGEA